jgi:hypothetical protein
LVAQQFQGLDAAVIEVVRLRRPLRDQLHDRLGSSSPLTISVWVRMIAADLI